MVVGLVAERWVVFGLNGCIHCARHYLVILLNRMYKYEAVLGVDSSSILRSSPSYNHTFTRTLIDIFTPACLQLKTCLPTSCPLEQLLFPTSSTMLKQRLALLQHQRRH